MIRITLTNWMAHRRLDLRISAPVAFLVGGNRRGKTAVRDGIEFAFLGTGELRGIATKKELALRSITDGESETEVAIETPRTRIRRTMKSDATQRLSVARREADGTWGDERPIALRDQEALFPMASDAVRACLDPTGFFRLDPTRRREILIAATTGQHQAAEIRAALLEALGAAAQEPDVTKLAEIAARDGFRAAEAHAVEQRKAAKREHAAITIPETTAHYDGIDLEKHTLADFEARLAEIVTEHQSAIAAQAAGAGHIQGQLDEAEREYKELLATAKPGVPDGACYRVLAEAEEAIAKWEAEVKALDARIADARAGAGLSADTFQRPKLCPAVPAPAELICPVKDTTFAKAIELAAGKRREAQAALDELETERNQTLDHIARNRTAAEGYRERCRIEDARKAKEESYHARADAIEARLTELTAKLKAAQAEPATADGASLADLAAKEERGRRIVAAKRAHDQAKAQAEQARKAQEAAQAAIDRWDAAATALKPEGIETRLGGDARGAFEAHLAQLEGLTGKLEIDGDFGIWAHDQGARRHHVQLSESHQRAVGMAVQHALARLLDFPLLCCDALDLFKGEWRGAWVAAATAIATDYPGGILGIAATDAEPPAPPPDGMQTAWLKADGSLALLGADFEEEPAR